MSDDDSGMDYDFPMRFYDDDGNELNPDLYSKPSLCLTCIHDDSPGEHLVCTLTRLGQRNDKEFECFAYKKR